MQIIADLQLHSKYSRAVSPEMTVPNIAAWCARKGIGLIATGDWTHPHWFREIETNLEEIGNGLLRLKKEKATESSKNILYLLATEVSSIYKQGGKLRRNHTLIWVPSIESARKINQEMTKQGCNLMSDGRPIIGLTSIQVAELVFTIEPKALVVPAHAWTPWFSVYGSLGGFDSIDEAFGPYAKYIYAVETGLSSNPAMNWQIPELDTRSVVSFSDAHSLPKIGREATVFEIPDGESFGYDHIAQALQNVACNPKKARIAYTIEFYPEEGKYHYNGHRACNIRQTPEETRRKGVTCPVCGKPVTVGVMQRVEDLSLLQSPVKKPRTESSVQLVKTHVDGLLTTFYTGKSYPHRPPYTMLVPLQEIIAESIGSPFQSKKTIRIYDKMLEKLGDEFGILLKAKLSAIEDVAGARIAEAVNKVRLGDIVIDPGYDGVFGVVTIWQNEDEKPLVDATKEQLGIF